MRYAQAVTLLYLLAAPVEAQMAHDHRGVATLESSVELLIERARSAAEVYTDRSAAIADGYRKVGRDLPMMGEHWLNTRLLVEGGFDVTRPQVLTYIDVGGKPVLTGVVFAVVLDPGESPPAVFGPTAMWHEHNGSIDEEALVPQHHTVAAEATGTRVAFLHVWTNVPSSETVFDAENWALPFVHAGVKVPASFSNEAARCLGIRTSGRDYYLDMFSGRIESSVFDECAAVAERVISRARTEHRAPTNAELDKLESVWRAAVARAPVLQELSH
jgi:hypothetical protein